MTVIVIAAAVILGIAAIVLLGKKNRGEDESPEKAFGNKGEEIAGDVIRSTLRRDDIHLSNISVHYLDQETELDNVVINDNGVFIIEVKNYAGKLKGRADDREWYKEKTTEKGNTYAKTVRNPIGQVKRQTYILSKYLTQNKVRAWVRGYVYLVQNNSPVKSPYVLPYIKDIEKALHAPAKRKLPKQTQEKIRNLLEMDQRRNAR